MDESVTLYFQSRLHHVQHVSLVGTVPLQDPQTLFATMQTSPGSFCFHITRRLEAADASVPQPDVSVWFWAHICPSSGFLQVSFFVTCSCSSCVSLRSAAPDLHKLNEDGELWLVNQGLKETVRCHRRPGMRLGPFHRRGERWSLTRSLLSLPEGSPAQAGAAFCTHTNLL